MRAHKKSQTLESSVTHRQASVLIQVSEVRVLARELSTVSRASKKTSGLRIIWLDSTTARDEHPIDAFKRSATLTCFMSLGQRTSKRVIDTGLLPGQW